MPLHGDEGDPHGIALALLVAGDLLLLQLRELGGRKRRRTEHLRDGTQHGGQVFAGGLDRDGGARGACRRRRHWP